MNRGVAYSIQNKFADALKDLNKAIELEPRKVDGYHNRALVLTKLGMLLEATTDYTTAIELNHRDVELYVAELGYGKNSTSQIRRSPIMAELLRFNQRTNKFYAA